MFGKYKGYIQLTLFAGISALWSSHAFAATECRFNGGYGGTATAVSSNYGGGTIRLPAPPQSGSGVLIGAFNATFDITVQGNCSMGNDGENLYAKTNTSIYKGTMYQNAVFQTNIPGLNYSVRIETSDGYGGYFDSNTSSFDIVVHNDGAESNWNKKQFHASIYMYITPDYKGNPNKLSVLKPVAGTWGEMSLGDPGDSNNQPLTFKISGDAFAIPLVLPTCDILSLSDSGNTVNLGDYYVSDIKNRNARDVPFALLASECTSTVKFTTKLTSNTLTGSGNTLLGNTLTSSAAKGVGVEIMYDNNQQLIPNNATSTYVVADDSVPGQKKINLIARLESNGQTVSAGQFNATGVFTMSYD